jgi:hypothetical protein
MIFEILLRYKLCFEWRHRHIQLAESGNPMKPTIIVSALVFLLASTGCGGIVAGDREQVLPARGSTSSKSCASGQLFAKSLGRCVSPVNQPVLPAYQVPAADPFEAAADNYAYQSSVASKQNHNRTFADQTIASGDIQVTTSVALAGAIASIRYKGFELIASGGHGAAAQLITHDWTRGKRDFSVSGHIVTKDDRPTECNNPTEAGNMKDDSGQVFPYHGPSSSYIGAWGQDTVDGLPRIYSMNAPVDYVPPHHWSEDSGYGRCYNTSDHYFRGYEFHKHVIIGLKKGESFIRNVIQVNARIKVGASAPKLDTTFIAYLSRYFVREYRFGTQDDVLVEKLRGMALKKQGASDVNECFANTSALPFVPIFANSDGGMAIAMLSAENGYPRIGYTQTHFDYHTPEYNHRFRNIAVKMDAKDLKKDQLVRFNVLLFVGSLADVQRDVKRYCALADCSGPQKHLSIATDPRVFDWREYLEINRDLGLTTRGEAVSHWLQYGLREGRAGNHVFWSPAYLARNPDVAAWAQTNEQIDHCRALSHYLTWGQTEGREI